MLRLMQPIDSIGGFSNDFNQLLWPTLAPDLFAEAASDCFLGAGTSLPVRTREPGTVHVFSGGAASAASYSRPENHLLWCVRGPLTAHAFGGEPATAITDGIEFTPDWRPIPHLDLSLTYGLDHTSVSSNCVAVNGVAVGACYEDSLDPYATAPGARPIGNLTSGVFYLQSVKGDELPNAPENKVAFNANYTWVFAPGNLTLSGTYVWRDNSYASIFTRVYDEAPSWSQVNLRAMWSGDHDRYEIILYCNNLFNTYGYDAAATGYLVGTGTPLDVFGAPLEPTPAGANIPTYAQQHATPSFDLTPPRLYGIELHYKF